MSAKTWELLHTKGIVEGDAPNHIEVESPWFVKFILGFSGWFAALFLFGFVGIGFAFVIENSAASFIVGILMLAGAFTVLQMPKNEFFEHLALAVSLAGQALIAWAIFDTSGRDFKSSWMTLAVVQSILALVMPNYLHRVFSSFFAGFSFSAACTLMGFNQLPPPVLLLLCAIIWLNLFKSVSWIKALEAVGYGLASCLLITKGTSIFNYRAWHPAISNGQPDLALTPWTSEIVTSLVLLGIVISILSTCQRKLNEPISIAVILSTILLCIVSLKAQGVTIGLAIMLLAFSVGNRVLLSLGVIALLFYVSAYYYFLEITLLDKSITLFTTGLVLLVGRVVMANLSEVGDENA